jgi:hypothetical protein
MLNLLDTYTTAHVPLAAYLKCKGVRIVNITAKDRRGTFVFENVDRQLIIDFNNGEAIVEPSDYAQRMSQLVQTAKRVVNETGEK